jgi:hypothetical protein
VQDLVGLAAHAEQGLQGRGEGVHNKAASGGNGRRQGAAGGAVNVEAALYEGSGWLRQHENSGFFWNMHKKTRLFEFGSES